MIKPLRPLFSIRLQNYCLTATVGISMETYQSNCRQRWGVTNIGKHAELRDGTIKVTDTFVKKAIVKHKTLSW